jgi:hypothetical protein
VEPRKLCVAPDFLPGASEGQRERRCALRSHRVSLAPPGKTTYTAERSCRAHTQSTHFVHTNIQYIATPIQRPAPTEPTNGRQSLGQGWRELSLVASTRCRGSTLFVFGYMQISLFPQGSILIFEECAMKDLRIKSPIASWRKVRLTRPWKLPRGK